MTATFSGRRLPAAIVGCLTLLVIGWTGLLIPSLIRSIKLAFEVDDAGIGVVYLAYALTYALGSFGGGPATERLGRPARREVVVPGSIPSVTPSTVRRPVLAGALGCLTLLVIGWTGLLVPSLIRSIKLTFDVTDAGIGLFYLLYSIFYATGSFGGGPATERLGRRTSHRSR